MDQQDLKEWKEFCKSPSRAGADRFSFIFMDSISNEELDEIFEHVPRGDELKPRLGRLAGLSDVTSLVEGPDRVPELEKLILCALAEKRSVLGLGEGTGLPSKLPTILDTILAEKAIHWMLPDEYGAKSRKGWVHAELTSLTGDVLRNSIEGSGWLTSSLAEATYGMKKNYDAVWYLMSPLVKCDYNAEPPIALQENGVHSWVTETEVLACDYRSAMAQ